MRPSGIVFAAIALLSGCAPDTGVADDDEALPGELELGLADGTSPVVSAASYAPDVAQGSLAAVFGPSIGGCTESASSLPLPTTICATRVLVGGVAAPIFAVTPDQINFQVPFDAPLGNSVSVVVKRSGQTVLDASARVVARAPGLFTVGATGDGPAAGNLQDGRNNAPGVFIPHGNWFAAYGTGLGASDSFATSGAPAPNAPLAVVPGVTALLGNRPLSVLFAGKAPGFVGLDQINVRIPEGTLSGRYLLRVCSGAVCSQSSATVGVQGPACDKPSLSPQGTKQVGGLNLNTWLGPERAGPVQRTPKYGIAVVMNGFDLPDINCFYRARLEWIDNAWDEALEAYRDHFGAGVALPNPTDFLDAVVINATLGYTTTSEVGATFYHSVIRTGPGYLHNRIEDVIYYKSSAGQEVSLCNNGIELEMIKGIGLWRGMPYQCAAQLDDVYDFDCQPKAAGTTLLAPICY